MTNKFVAYPALVALTIIALASQFARAERPVSHRVLPERSVAYIRVADVQELVARFQDTSLGRMAREQQLKSLAEQLYAEAEKALQPLADEVGLTLPQLLAIPQGEVTFAIVAPESGRPAPVLMVDIGPQQPHVNKLLDYLNEQMQSRGLKESTQTESGITMTVLRTTGERQDGAVYFQKDQLLVITSHIDVATHIAAVLGGDQEQLVLDDNEKFKSAMSHSLGPRGESPQIKWFVDPIDLVKVTRRGNFGAQAALAALPVLGLDGLSGLGGSLTLASAEYDSFMQLHVLLEEPRTGVLAMLALESGETSPEDWVPHDVADYQTMHWNIKQTESEFQTLYDSFRGEGGFQRDMLQRANERLGVDLSQDILNVFGGRISLASWYERPARPGEQAMLGGILLKPDHEFDKTLEKIIETTAPDAEKKTYGSVSYYQLIPQTEDGDESSEDGAARRRAAFRPCLAVIDDYLLIGNIPSAFERGIRTRSDSSKSLANELDYKLIASKLRRQPGGNAPSRIAFGRPEEGIRALLDLATADETRRRLAEGADDNEFLGTLKQALDDNPLPPFAVIRKYLAPTGSIMTSDKSGIHLTSFGLRRNSP